MIRIFLLLSSLLAFSDAFASSHEYFTYCNSCTTQTQFNQQAIASTPNVVGLYDVLVGNKNTNKMYRIFVQVEGDVIYGGQHLRTLVSSTTSTALDQEFAYWYPKFVKPEFHYVAPSGAFLQTFASTDQGQVCSALTGTDEFIALAIRVSSSLGRMVWGRLREAWGRATQAVVVYQNGDVGTYEVYPLLPGIPGCKYTKGSARNVLGQFIDDSGQGGNNITNGSDYVEGSAGTYNMWVTLRTYTLSCSYWTDNDGRRHVIGCIAEQ